MPKRKKETPSHSPASALDLGSGDGAISYTVEAWDIALGYLSAHILAQAGFNGLMGNPTYDPISDALYVNGNPYDAAVQFADQAGGGATLEHLATNDIFVLFPGDAPVAGPYNSPSLYIHETANGGGTNTIVLGVAPADVTLSTDQDGDLLVQYTATDTVEIQATMVYNNHDANGYGGSTAGQYVQQIVFNDGTVENLTGGLYLTATPNQGDIYGTSVGGDTLDGSQITSAVLHGTVGTETFIAGPESTMIAGVGTNIYVINPGSCPTSSGGASIYTNPYSTGDTVLLHDVTPSQMSASDDTSGQLILSTANGDEVQIQGSFGANGLNPGIAQVDYDNGDVWNLSGVVTFNGSSAVDMYGFASGTNFVADGNEHNFYGYSTSDIFSFTSGSAPVSAGGDSITEHAALGSQTIAFHGILPSAVTIADNPGGNLIFTFGTDQVTLGGGSFNWSEGLTSIGNVEQATFDNGTVWNLQSALPLTATGNYQGLYGLENGGCSLTADGWGDYLYAFGGSVTLVAGDYASLYNGSGNDTDVFNPGFGRATVYLDASGGSTNIIEFHDVTESQLAIYDTPNGNLYISDGSGDLGSVVGGSINSSGLVLGNIQELAFDDGTVWNLQTDLQLTATGNYETLYALASGDSSLTADGYGDYLYNGGGTDTDVLVAGDGQTYVYADTSGTALIDLHSVNPSAVTLWDDSSGHLFGKYSSSDQFELFGGSYSSSSGVTLPTGEITFDSSYSTTWNLANGLTLTATNNGQSIYGTVNGADTLVAAGINENLHAFGGTETLVGGVGATLYNGTGIDTDVFTAGASPTYNIDWIEANTHGGTAHIYLEGINPNNVSVWDDTSGHLWIQYTSSDLVEVFGGSYSSSSGFALNGISEVTFDSGYNTTWNMTGGLTLTATSDNQSLYGTSVGGDTLTALGNNDYLYAYAGNNTLTGANSETNNLYGGSGNDTFVDGGGTATNYMYAGSGVDTFKIESGSSSTDVYNFNTSNGSTIHVEDVLSGYDPVADALANWVQTSTSGGNTIVSVDTTGSGHFTNALVTIEGVTGLGSAADMVTHGQLVVHA